MASDKQTIEYYADQMSAAGEIRYRAMFGEYGVYCDEKVVAFICDNELFVKPTEVGYSYLDASYEAPPYPGAKNYLQVPQDKIDDHSWLSEFIRATAVELPPPKPKS